MEALARANRGTAHAYAEDDWSARLDDAFSERFETAVSVVPMSTGTVCNAIALACVSPPWGTVFCHRSAHVYNDESGAPEFFGNGLRLVPVEGARASCRGAHWNRPSAPARGMASTATSRLRSR